MKKLEYNRALKRSQNITVSYSDLEDILPSNYFSPECRFEDIAKLVSEFLRNENEDSRNVFIRKYYFFDSIGTIAARYSYTESKVKNMLYHSRIKLKKFLKKEGIDV